MTLSLNQAQDMVQKLSNEQLMHAYTSGSVPQFVVFSEMQRRQQAQNANAKMPTQTVAERMVGREEQGIPAARPPLPNRMPPEAPQMAARGGPTKASSLTLGAKDLPEGALNSLRMRYAQMNDLDQPLGMAGGGSVDISNKDIARMIMPSLINVESGGKQEAISNKGAAGVAQLLESTAKDVANRHSIPWDFSKYKNDKAYNADLGHRYLTEQLDRFGDREQALAAYNAGPTAVARALEKAKASGRPWMSFLPRETQAYVPKVMGGAQASLPQRQDPEGPDAQPSPYGFDNAFGGGATAYSGFKYPGKEEPTNVDKGLAAIMAAKQIQGLRFAGGGNVDIDTELGDERINNIKAAEALSQQIKKDQEEEDRKPAQDMLDWRRKQKERAQNNRTQVVPQPFDMISPEDSAAEAATSPGLFRTPITPPGYTPPPPPQGGSKPPSGIPAVGPMQPGGEPTPPPEGLASIRTVPDSLTPQPPVQQGGNAPAPMARPPGAGPRGIPGGGTGGTGMAGGPGGGPQDTDFASIFKQIQSVTGDLLSDEKKQQIMEHGKIMQSMQNDKLVDTLLAAAKTLAGQRVGQQNFGDAVANAGIAAQEAQKRIYKAEDDMRKYRYELAKAQEEGNQKAATIAMNRLIHLDADKSAMARAVMQTNKYIQSQEGSEKRANIGAASKELVTMLAARNKLEQDINKYKSDYSKAQDVQAWEAERSRLDNQIAGARQQLHYFQTGQDFSQIEAEMKKRGLL